MTPEQIREIVKITIDELAQRKEYQPANYSAVLQVMDVRLYKFFGGTKDADIANLLRQYSDDTYIDVIYLQYRDRVTIERIADIMEKDASTIKRNKKRLIMSMYKQLT